MENNWAASGADGIARLVTAHRRNAPFDLVILDMDMPEMNGLETARLIRKTPGISRVRMIMLTSVGLRGDLREAEAAGIGAHLTKPVRQADLLAAILRVADAEAPGKRPGILPLDRDRVSLPRPDAVGASPPAAASGIAHILLAEDNETNQAVAAGMLRMLGYGVTLAANGRQAVDAMTARAFDLVFMDCQMPVLDGYQATAEIRRMERDGRLEKHVPIVALTANALEGDREFCISCGMDDYLSKPFRHEDLQEMVVRWVGGPAPGEMTEGRPTPGPIPVPAPEDGRTAGASEEGEDTPPSLDREAIKALAALQIEGEPSIIQRVLEAYLRGADTLLTELADALPDNDTEALRRSAHSLKSSSANVGALKLFELSRELEMACRSGILENPADQVAAIQSEYTRVKGALQQELSTHEP